MFSRIASAQSVSPCSAAALNWSLECVRWAIEFRISAALAYRLEGGRSVIALAKLSAEMGPAEDDMVFFARFVYVCIRV